MIEYQIIDESENHTARSLQKRRRNETTNFFFNHAHFDENRNEILSFSFQLLTKAGNCSRRRFFYRKLLNFKQLNCDGLFRLIRNSVSKHCFFM